MISKGKGGGNTRTGLNFEKRTDLLTLLDTMTGYRVSGNVVYYFDDEVARSFKKNGLYKFLESKGIDYRAHLSKKLLPDEALYVIVNNTLFVVEIKFQQGSGSVDEKLQTCDFKKKQYKKLLSSVNIDVEYIYLLNDWFRQPQYKDTLDYVISVGCHYYFHYLPLQKLGLPVPPEGSEIA